MKFSVIVPVYNRPDEIREFLQSVAVADDVSDLEIVVVEDGSPIPCREVVEQFPELNIQYYFKENSGPGDSRNFGMRQAQGDYFLIFDSDCIIPPQYFTEVKKELASEYTDCFGGPDAALDTFSDVQKAINFAMTSFLTTGGVRGGSSKNFQPRSFNMGISRKAFEASGGFGNIHPGEDPDLVLRLWKMGFTTRLFPQAWVYHKRRIDWKKYHLQVSKFGKARPILNRWHPEYTKVTFWFPTFFVIGFYLSCLLLLIGCPYLLMLYLVYFATILMVSSFQNGISVGLLSVAATAIQFFGYGNAFLFSWYRIFVLKKSPEKAFPELFFKR